jgi:transcriptional regulator with XRE-family HTH domain
MRPADGWRFNRNGQRALKKSANHRDTRQYGRGTGVPDPVDIHVGGQVRALRRLIGMSQQTLARLLGLAFQQVQKYESGANMISVSRLSQIADILRVPISYFFSDLEPDGGEPTARDRNARQRLQRPETIELIRSYYAIADQKTRQQFVEMVKVVAQRTSER